MSFAYLLLVCLGMFFTPLTTATLSSSSSYVPAALSSTSSAPVSVPSSSSTGLPVQNATAFPVDSIAVGLTIDIASAPNAAFLDDASPFIVDLTLDLAINVASLINNSVVNASDVLSFLRVTYFDDVAIPEAGADNGSDGHTNGSGRRLLQSGHSVVFVLEGSIGNASTLGQQLQSASQAGALVAPTLQGSGAFGTVSIPAQTLTVQTVNPAMAISSSSSSSAGASSSTGDANGASSARQAVHALAVVAMVLCLLA